MDFKISCPWRRSTFGSPFVGLDQGCPTMAYLKHGLVCHILRLISKRPKMKMLCCSKIHSISFALASALIGSCLSNSSLNKDRQNK